MDNEREAIACEKDCPKLKGTDQKCGLVTVAVWLVESSGESFKLEEMKELAVAVTLSVMKELHPSKALSLIRREISPEEVIKELEPIVDRLKLEQLLQTK